MRKNNVSLALLAVMTACGAINAAGAQSPTMPGAPMATPAMNSAASVRAVAAPSSVQIPTPSKNRIGVKGHIQHNQIMNADAFSDAQDLSAQKQKTAEKKTGPGTAVFVNAPAVQPLASMGVFNPSRQSITNQR